MSAFSTAETKFLSYLDKEGIRPHLETGVLLALSGGKDSSLLLSLLLRLRQASPFPLWAFHLNHGIRGEEADEDADFCAALCGRYGVPLVSLSADIPTLAKQAGEGLEEAARRERYRLLQRTAKEKGLGVVLTAHNATDNLETVLMNLVRGGGGNAMCGIPPLRPLSAQGEGTLLARPLLCLSAEEVLDAVTEAGLSYVTDSTNDDTAYRRNLMRREVLPHLRACNAAVERSVLRLTENMREDMTFLDALATDALDNARVPGGARARALLSLPRPLAYRALRLLHAERFPESPLPERVHIDALLCRLAEDGDFSVSFPGDIRAVREGDTLFFCEKETFSLVPQILHIGENVLSDGGRLYIMEEGSPPPNKNIYTLSIQAVSASATIEAGLCARSKTDGDAYRTRGMHRKLKKLFSDAGIPPRLRPHFPVVTDEEGILWVPPFGAREGKEGRKLSLFYAPPAALLEEMWDCLARKQL